MPPVAPMLAKSVKDVPDGPGFLYEPKWDGFRCIVFRDGDEVELGSRNETPDDPLLPRDRRRRCKEQLPERCVVDARDRHRGPATSSTSRRCCSASTRPSPGSTLLAEQTPASLSWSSTCSRSATSPIWTLRWASGAPKLDQALGGVTSPVHRTSVTDDPALAREWFEHVRGRRPGRHRRQAGRRLVRAGQARRCSRSSTSGPRTAWSPASAGTRRARRSSRCSARCCSASTTTRAGCSTSASSRVVPDGAPGRARRGAGAVAGERAGRPPLAGLGRGAGPVRGPDAGRAVPLERQEGPVLGAAAARARGRGPVRPHGGDPVPAHHPVRPLARRPRPGLLHVRAARASRSRTTCPACCP